MELVDLCIYSVHRGSDRDQVNAELYWTASSPPATKPCSSEVNDLVDGSSWLRIAEIYVPASFVPSSSHYSARDCPKMWNRDARNLVACSVTCFALKITDTIQITSLDYLSMDKQMLSLPPNQSLSDGVQLLRPESHQRAVQPSPCLPACSANFMEGIYHLAQRCLLSDCIYAHHMALYVLQSQ